MREPVWDWFGLSYAAHLVLSRRALCSMPEEWQDRFVALMEEAQERLPEEAICREYWVRRKEGGKFAHDPDTDYRHAKPYVLRNGEHNAP